MAACLVVAFAAVAFSVVTAAGFSAVALPAAAFAGAGAGDGDVVLVVVALAGAALLVAAGFAAGLAAALLVVLDGAEVVDFFAGVFLVTMISS